MVARQAEYDALVIGGGPAGSTTAALLAKQGHHALIVEKSVFPRFHTGESLLPGSWPIFWKLGIAEDLERSGQQKKIGARFNLFGKREYVFGIAREVAEHLPENRGKYYAFNVIRATFDRMLLDNARRLGVEVMQPATVEEVLFDGTRAVGATVITQDGEHQTLRSKVVVDATGRDCVVSRRLGIRNPDTRLHKISYFTHFKGATHPREEYTPIWLLAFEGGWVWYIPLMDDLASVGIVVDASYAKTRGDRDLETFFRDTIAHVPYVAEWIAGAERVTDVHAISALAYLTDHFAGDGWMLVGDAIGFVDPMFSAGIHIALTSGDLASQTIAHALETGDFSAPVLGRYETRLREQLNVIVPMIYRWYELIGDPKSAATFFDTASRFTWLRRKVNASLVGAWEAVGKDPALQFGQFASSGREAATPGRTS